MFYEVQATFISVRAPFRFDEEKPRSVPPEEKPNEKIARDVAYATRSRLEDHSELFARLHATRFRFMAVFGKAQSEPFVEIHNLKMSLIVASHIYTEQLNKASTLGPEEDIKPLFEEHARLFKILYCITGDSDDFSKRVDAEVEKIEQICNDAIQTNYTSFDRLMDTLTLPKKKR